jgi:hypothetical protein
MNPSAPPPVEARTIARPLPRRRGWRGLGWLAASPTFLLFPKCGLCVWAGLAAFAGLGFEACGPNPSGSFLAAEFARRFGWTAAVLAAASPLPLAVGAVLGWRLARRATRGTQTVREC